MAISKREYLDRDNARGKRNRLKGFKGDRNPKAYARNLSQSKEWNKQHRLRCSEADRRYKHKLAKEAGGYSIHLREIVLRKRAEARARRIKLARQGKVL